MMSELINLDEFRVALKHITKLSSKEVMMPNPNSFRNERSQLKSLNQVKLPSTFRNYSTAITYTLLPPTFGFYCVCYTDLIQNSVIWRLGRNNSNAVLGNFWVIRIVAFEKLLRVSIHQEFHYSDCTFNVSLFFLSIIESDNMKII